MARTSRAVDSPEAPRLEGELDVLALGPESFGVAASSDVEGAHIAGANLVGVRAGGVRFHEARLVDADLGGARLDGLQLVDVAIDRGNFANLTAPELSLRRVAVSSARLTGAQWTRGSIADTLFLDCRIDLATFAGTTFERTTFENCLLARTDFRESLLRSVRFDRCDLTEADLTLVRLDRCELRGCTLDGLTAADRLRGAAMPWEDVVGNAGLLATTLGIRILDPGEIS